MNSSIPMPRTILITGATSGFGKAIATRFAREGNCRLILTGRRAERLQALQAQLAQPGVCEVVTLPFDIRNRDAVNQAAKTLSELNVDCLDMLVNNAGLAAGLGPIDMGDPDDWEQMIDTNVKGLLYATHAFLPFLKKSKAAHIINIGSTAGKDVYANGNVYCATKHAVDALNRAMRIDLLPYGIKVTAINPGLAETEFSVVRFKGDEAKARSVYEGYEPLHAEDIADVVWYCAGLPPHVCINDLTLTCLTQADSYYKIKEADLKR